MKQNIYIKLDPACQEWVVNAWGNEINKKNMLGIIIGPYIDYVPKDSLIKWKSIVNNPNYLEFSVFSRFNDKDLRQAIYVDCKYHHEIEISIKNAMRIDFLNWMDYAIKYNISVTSLIQRFIDHNNLPGDKLTFEYFKKHFYNNRNLNIAPKNRTSGFSIGFG